MKSIFLTILFFTMLSCNSSNLKNDKNVKDTLQATIVSDSNSELVSSYLSFIKDASSESKLDTPEATLNCVLDPQIVFEINSLCAKSSLHNIKIRLSIQDGNKTNDTLLVINNADAFSKLSHSCKYFGQVPPAGSSE